MSVRAPLFLVSLLTGAGWATAQAPQQTADTALLRWNVIEIVTNDFDSVERLREVTGIRPGALLALNDPRVQDACDAVRRATPGKSVRCTQLFGDKVDGYGEAGLVVEIQPPSDVTTSSKSCSSTILAPDLVALRNAWGRAFYATRFVGHGSPEFVNVDQYLDDTAPEVHQLVVHIHTIVGARVAELERAVTSCSAMSRADAIYLMDFTGSPLRAIRVASKHMDDPDADVRNAAVRLLGVFNGFILEPEVAVIVRGACAMAMSETFSDRNKSLVLLYRLQQGGRLTFANLGSGCQNQIRAIARTSNAPQTGRAAQYLLDSASVEVRK